MRPFRRFYICLIISLFAYSSQTIGQGAPTDVFIIGTSHVGNPLIQPDTYITLFYKIQPAVILVELDSNAVKNCSLKESFGSSLAQTLGLYKPAIEDIAVKKYRNAHQNVCLIAFDVIIPNRGKYIKLLTRNSRTLFDRLHEVYLNGKMNSIGSITYTRFLSVDRSFFKTTDSSLQTMNTDETTHFGRLLMHYKKDTLPQFFRTYLFRKDLGKWYHEDMQFWTERNMKMCENILSAIKENRSKKIIVLTGLLHKYFLQDWLESKRTEYNFQIHSAFN